MDQPVPLLRVDTFVFSQANNLFNFVQEDRTSKELLDSILLIGSSVFRLFSDTRLPLLARYLLTAETTVDTTKREVVFLTKNLDSNDLLAFLETVPLETMQRIGSDFFFVTSKKISKNQSIETYSKFLFVLLRNYGFNSAFIKNFFVNDRDSDEVEALLKYISAYPVERLLNPLSYIISKTLIIAIERLSSKQKISELFPLLFNRREMFLAMDKVELNKSLTKVFVACVQVALADNDFTSFKRVIDFFQSIEFELTEQVCNRVLESLNKSVVDDSIIEYFLKYMREHSISPNIVSYNTVMDYYCSNQKMDRALEVYEKIKACGIKTDNFTFTILIKGLRMLRDASNPKIEQIIDEYRTLAESRDVVIYNSFIDLYVYLGNNEKAKAVYDKLLADPDVHPDQVTFNTLIKGACKNKELEPALIYLGHMKRQEIKPNRITYNSLMDIAVKLQDMKQALVFLEDMKRDEIAPDGYTYSIILNGLKINNSYPDVVKATIENIAKVVAANEFKLDEVFFNSVLDVCSKYDFYDLLRHFYDLMRQHKIAESSVTYGILIKAYGKANDFDNAQRIFDRMLASNMVINEMTYGCILDACAKSGKMDVAMRIFETLKSTNANLNSIVFTTIIKGYMNSEHYDKAIHFFNSIRPLVDLPGMIITYNCMLDLYVKKNDMKIAEALFQEIEERFKADLISYSTIIKGLCNNGRKEEAWQYIQKMMRNNIEIDISVINLFLDSCSTVTDYRLGIQVYQEIMLKNVTPNEITFGIMIKIYGFARELQKAFDLLELMEVYDIRPSIIIFTNLIHISFYNKNPKKAEVAFLQFKRHGGLGDKLMYSKLVEGLIKFKETAKLMRYVEMALEDTCTMKPEVIAMLEEIFADEAEDMEIIQKVKHLKYVERNTYNNADKFKNKVSSHNTQRFKAQMQDKSRQGEGSVTGSVQGSIPGSVHGSVQFNAEPPKQRREGLNMAESRPAFAEKKVLFKEREVKEYTKSEHKSEYSKKESTKKPATLFNFRQNAKK
jgi:pentatricopeptide repeat domain-containing protein 1